MKWRWLIGVPLVLVAGGCGAIMTLAHIEAGDEYQRQRTALTDALTKHGEAFRADLRVASALPMLGSARAVSATRDAGPFLRERLAAATVPPGLARKINDVVIGKFPQRALDIDVSAVSLAWMSELASFDHWELLEERPVGFHTMTVPDEQVVLLARVRLLQGLAARDLKTAGRDVEELARLAASSEHAELVLAAPTLMQLARQSFEHGRAEGLDVEGWHPAERKTVDAVRRALRAYPGALDFHVDPSLHGDLLTSPDASAGRCAALNDVATTYLEMRPVTGGRYRDAHEWVTRALEATKQTCRLTLVREAWDDPEQRVLVVGTDAMCDAEGDPGACIAASFFASFPGVRDFQVEAFTVSAADLFSGYLAPRADPKTL